MYLTEDSGGFEPRDDTLELPPALGALPGGGPYDSIDSVVPPLLRRRARGGCADGPCDEDFDTLLDLLRFRDGCSLLSPLGESVDGVAAEVV